MNKFMDIITSAEAKTLPGLFRERLRRTPDKIAYTYFSDTQQQWNNLTWQQVECQIQQWHSAFCSENIQPGDNVSIMLRNCPEWVMFDQAAARTGLVTVPLYTNDRADNIAYIINDANVKLLLIEGDEHWQCIKLAYDQLDKLERIITIKPIPDANDKRIIALADWLAQSKEKTVTEPEISAESLATIVYTSGTTGKPKGVMLSHHNIVWNAYAGTQSIPTFHDDIFLSFLPLSHTLERTIGYYYSMMCGSSVSYARSIELLAEDLIIIKPTILITVPRIFERVNNKIQLQLSEKPPVARKLFAWTINIGWHRFQVTQGRASWHPKQLFWPLLNLLIANKTMAKLGGRIRFAISGGAPLSEDIAKTFIGLGLTISQGYGLTETSPVISVNKLNDNLPTTVGQPLQGVEIQLDDDELVVRSPGVMLGYWNNENATKEIIDEGGWLHTGDKAKIIDGHIQITGRLKDIIVMSNGEKVPPADIELAIANNALFEQVMIIGEGKPFLSAIVVINPDKYKLLIGNKIINEGLRDELTQKEILNQINNQLTHFPGYANIYKVHATLEPWTVENELITPTLKLKRDKLYEKFKNEIDLFYRGH